MEEFQRTLIKHMILYRLEKRDWDYYMDVDGEFSFVLGNREPNTRNMNSQELLELLDEIVRW